MMPTNNTSFITDFTTLISATAKEKKEYFKDYSRAKRVLASLIVLWIAIYGGYQLNRLQVDAFWYELPWKCYLEEDAAKARAKANNSQNPNLDQSCLTEQEQMKYGPLFLRGHSLLDIIIRVERVKQYISLEQIEDLQFRLEKEVLLHIPKLRENRKIVITETRQLLSTHFNGQPALSILTKKNKDNTLTDFEIETADLTTIHEWLAAKSKSVAKASKGRCYIEKSPNNKLHLKLGNDKNSAFEESNLVDKNPACTLAEEVVSVANLVNSQLEKETNAFFSVKASMPSLHPQLNFQWLFHEDVGWIIELIAWTIIGVLVNASVSLTSHILAKNYNPCIFIMFSTRLLTAPIMSVVIIAMLAAGLTEASFTVVNLPYFLVLSFALGFGSERVVRIVQTAVKGVLGGMAMSSEKLAKETKGKVYRLLYKQPPSDRLPQPETFNQARQKAIKLAKSETEQGMIDAVRGQ